MDRTTAASTAYDSMAIPAFLLVKRAGRKGKRGQAREVVAARPKSDDEGIRLNEQLRPYGLRVPALGESGESGFRIGENVIPRHWAHEPAVVMELARQLAAKKEQYERHSAERDEARAKAEEERKKMKARMYRGMIGLSELLNELGASAPSTGRARKAIERAHLIHRKFHFGPKEVDQARQVLRALPETSTRRAGATSAGSPSPRATSPALVGFIRVLVKANPHKPGSVQHDRMGVLMASAGKSSADFLAAGGCKYKLKHALDQGWVRLDQTAGALAPAPKTKASSATPDPEKRLRAEASKIAKATGIPKISGRYSSLGASLEKAKAKAKVKRK